MRILLQPAYILHTRPYRETSVIAELFTQDFGRIAIVAKGVRQGRSPLKSLLQPFNSLVVSWQGKSELMSLIKAEPNGPSPQLQGNALLSGFYLNELLLRLLQKQDPHPNLYTVYQKTLVELSARDFLPKALRLFEKNLLEELGYGIQLKVEGDTQRPLRAEGFYRYHPELGFVATAETSATDLFVGKNLLALASETLPDEASLQAAKKLMRLILTPLLGDRPLQSRKLFVGIEK